MSSTPLHRFHLMLKEAMLYERDFRESAEKLNDYYDGTQWTDEQRYEIEERGQQATTLNIIRPTVDMVRALERNVNQDITVVGRESGDDDKAKLFTELLSQVNEHNRFDYYKAQSLMESLVNGRGWLGVDVERDMTGKQQILVDQIPWEELYIDPFHRKPDGSDARYMIRVKWIDRDEAKKLYPSKEADIDAAYDDTYEGIEYEAQKDSGATRPMEMKYYDVKTSRCMICECYYSVPQYIDKEIMNERTGKKESVKVFIHKIHRVVFSGEIILDGSATDDNANKNPLKIDYFPWVPIYVSRDRKGRPVGIVKNLIDIQDQINKLYSKFIWIVSANRVILEEDAVHDIDGFTEQMQRPDGVGRVKSGKINSVKVAEVKHDLGYLVGQIQMLLALSQRISGVNDSMLGIGGTNERSGVMQQTRIAQGASMQTGIFENFYFSINTISQLILRLIGEFYTDYRVVRITSDFEAIKAIEFNKLKDDGSLENGIEDMINYDVIFKRVSPYSSVRDRNMQLFSEILKSGKFPEPLGTKLWIEMWDDLPNKKAYLAELDAMYQQQAAAMAAQQGAAQPPQAIGA